MRRIRFLALLLVAGCAFINPALKSNDGITRLNARVVEGTRGVPNVAVTITTRNGDTMRRFTGAAGIAAFEDIIHGDYTVSITAPPTYNSIQQTHHVVIEPYKTASVTFQLQKVQKKNIR